MKWFGRTGGYYMFWSGFLYFAVGMYCIFVNNFVPVWLAQLTWITVLCLPFAIPPFGRWLNMSVEWDKNMFNWFRSYKKSEGSVAEDMNKIMNDVNKVVNLPAPKLVPPQVEPPKKEEPAKIYYRFGLTDNNRVAFSMGYSEITMNAEGCQQMIDQLKFFQSQLTDDDDTGGDDPDGGLPLPEEVTNERKAA